MKKNLIIFLLIPLLMLIGCQIAEQNIYRLTVQDGTEIYTISTGKTQTFYYDNLPVLTKAGYDFIGWGFDESGNDLLEQNKAYSLTSDLTLYAIWKQEEVNYFEIASVGTVDITTNKAITSKQDYVNCTIKLDDERYKLSETTARIRLRGNSSLSAPKKSYKLKFDSKVDLYNMGSDKEWALIANYYDPSLIRNFLAYRLAKAMGMEYAIDCEMVEVYLNDAYQGLYLLCETVKTGSSRVDIEVDYNETASSIPFLLEMDFKMVSNDDPLSNGTENIDYFYLNSYKKYPIAAKYPDTYDETSITTAQYQYIKTYIRDMYQSLPTNNYTNYLDQASCIDFFIIQELFMNIDLDYSSVYWYKTQDGLLKFGPVWDFDISLGNCNYVNSYGPLMSMANVNGGSYLFNTLMKHSAFRQAYLKRLNEVVDDILPLLHNELNNIYNLLLPYATKDNYVWNTWNTAYWPKPNYLIGLTYQEQIDYIQRYLLEHSTWMIKNM